MRHYRTENGVTRELTTHKVRNTLLVGLLVASVAVWSYNLGSLYPQAIEEPLLGYTEHRCDEIVRVETGNLICEVQMNEEDDNLRIFKGAGAYGDN